ncbi:unnamed protein product [Didymodactylos carnosus]|uniref:Nicotinic acetylcholine receptor beta 1 subunit n=2 Tax=Didymodactylos carnosus TaxID=1234261 RepID=A0A813TJI3_9BILA|nr:unnamed protein product [Didymodactylos carnosus]CAF3599592.1 unnamed protein product [Didymodactylos carnosus]
MIRSCLIEGLLVIYILPLINDALCSYHEEQLYDYIFKGYNPLIRPVKKVEETITVHFSIALLQLISVVEKEQVMKTNVWLQVKWYDYQLQWNPEKYGGIGSIRVPPDKVWTPDLVLFNNADGKYEASYKCNVVIYSNGDMNWVPPAIYKSSCYIDVKFFPFDQQTCELRFGSWTYDHRQMNFTYYEEDQRKVTVKDYVVSGSWDLIDGPMSIQDEANSRLSSSSLTSSTQRALSLSNSSTESSVTEVRLDQADARDRVEFVCKLVIRRKTLFYTINLIVPTVLISFLSIFVFYLPTDAGEKMTLSISILLALVVFLLLISKILPPTSIVIPLIAKYLLFTFIMNIITIFQTVVIINWNYRTPRTHNMPMWVRKLCIDILPRILCMERPKKYEKEDNDLEEKNTKHNYATYIQAARALSIVSPAMSDTQKLELKKRTLRKHPYSSLQSTTKYINDTMKHTNNPSDNTRSKMNKTMFQRNRYDEDEDDFDSHDHTNDDYKLTKEAYEAADHLRYVANHMRTASQYEAVRDDWKYIASVIDRLQLYVFFAVTTAGTFGILFNAPYIFQFVDQQAILNAWT